MKAVLNIILFSVLVIGVSSCKQRKPEGGLDIETKTIHKDAKRYLMRYNLDPTNYDLLKKASDQMEPVIAELKEPSNSNNALLWQTYAEINAKIFQLNTKEPKPIPSALDLFKNIDLPDEKAMQGFKNSYDLSSEKSQKKDALEGLKGLQYDHNASAVRAQSENDKEAAFYHSSKLIVIHRYIRNYDGESALTDEQYLNNLLVSALLAMRIDKNAAAKIALLELREMKFQDAGVYNNLYKLTKLEGDNVGAEKYLTEGIKIFPDNALLIFSQINVLQEKGNTAEIVKLVPKAMRMEPNNTVLYSIQGNSLGELSRNAFKAGDVENGNSYFRKAEIAFNGGLAVEKSNFNLQYGLGSLHYNRGADLQIEFNKRTADIIVSPKEHNEKTLEIKKHFLRSLPFFKACESSRPGDLNTLIALKQIYVIQEDMVMYKEFKARMGKVQNGEKITSSYFKK